MSTDERRYWLYVGAIVALYSDYMMYTRMREEHINTLIAELKNI